MIVLRVCVVAALCVVPVCADAAPADDDVGPTPAAPEAGEVAVADGAEGPEAAPVSAAAPTKLPGVEVTTAKRVRHDWYVGFGFGLGAGNLKPQADGTGSAVSGVLMGLVRGGGRISDKIAVGGLAVTALGGGNGAARGLTNLMVEGLFFPVKGRGLALGVALGLSSAYGGRAMSADVATATVDPVRGGVGFGLGVGYDFWLARRFNLGIWARADGSGGPRYGLRAAGTLGLAFAWY